MRFRTALATLSALPALVAAPRVQSPDAAWITFTTPHYRIHCPKPFEAFGRDVASRVEGIHAQYLALVGYVHPAPIDVLILDPVMEANGMAFPFTQRPMVVLWRTEPEADSAIGHHRGWAELLVAHEMGHMHHLLRPARTPTLLERLTGTVGPLPRKAPRWVIEGYATVLEGRLTGSGRPHSPVRAAVLRQWALEGKLPPYEALDGMNGFMGGNMAYLAGSAYLAWLEERAGDPQVLKGLWTRLAGRRDFDAAFTATFGFGPRDGYQRFCAETTHTALELERRMKAQGLREGEAVTQLKGWASDLSVSPDGTKLLARVLDPKAPGLCVWDLTAKPKPGPKPKDAAEPPDHTPAVPTLAPTWRLGRQAGSLPAKPVWTADGAVAYELRLPDAEGVLQPVRRRWVPGGRPAAGPARPARTVGWKAVDGIWNLVDGQGQPLTRTLGAAWNPAPTPDGKAIYFTQLTATGLQIRRLDATQAPLASAPLPADPAPLVAGVVLPRADEPSPLPPPVPVEPHPYRLGESHRTFLLTGYSDTPSGVNGQIGGGGNDLLGRLNWQVLAGLGKAAGPRGGMAGASWHGWAWAPEVQVFSALEQPSKQDRLAVAGFDRERRGAELALGHEDLGRPRLAVQAAVAFERLERPGLDTLGRSLAGLQAGLGQRWAWDRQALSAAARMVAQRGRTDGHAWTLTRLRVQGGWDNPWAPLALKAEAGRLGGEPTPFDRFHLGGVPSSLVPLSLDANRVVQAALPAYSALGDRMVRVRAELGHPLVAYVEHTAVWQDPLPRPAAQRVAGLELDSQRLGLPLDVLRRLMGNVSFTVGVHRPLDGVMKDRTVGTFTLLVRP